MIVVAGSTDTTDTEGERQLEPAITWRSPKERLVRTTSRIAPVVQYA